MLSILTLMEINFSFVIVKVIIANLTAFASCTFMSDFLSSEDYGPPVVWPWNDAPNPGLMHLNLLSVELGEKLRTSFCKGSDFVSTNVALPLPVLRLNCPSREDLEIISWIFWCCKALYWRRAWRNVKYNGPINFLSSLTHTSDFCKSSVYWVFIFPNFSCARLRVIFCESSNTATNSKVDGWSSINFWVLIKNPRFRSRNINLSQAISSPSWEVAIKSISSRYITILIQSFHSKDIGTFINLVKTLGPEESPKHRHKKLYNKTFH